MTTLQITLNGQHFTVEIEAQALAQRGDDLIELTVTVDGQPLQVVLPAATDDLAWLLVDDRPYDLVVGQDLDWIAANGRRYALSVRDSAARLERPVSRDGRVKAPIPGVITRVLVEPGTLVEAGQPLLILEAMKMENEIRAPRAGSVEQIAVQPGQKVMLGQVLAEVA